MRVTFGVNLSPTFTVLVLSPNTIDDICWTTVTSHVFDTPLPSLAVHVMFVVPALTPVIFPFDTVAISGFSDCQITFLSSAFSGSTVCLTVSLCPTYRVRLSLSKSIEPTYLFTVSVNELVFSLPSTAVAVIVVCPLSSAVMRPSWSIVATFSSDDVQMTS